MPEETVPKSSYSPASSDDPEISAAAATKTTFPASPKLAEIEERLKWKTYEQLQRFLQEKKFPQAIALVEALAARLPKDTEVRQWQAIAYQIWGRALIDGNQRIKAKIYLQKALKTDPHNKALWQEVQRDFQRLGQIR